MAFPISVSGSAIKQVRSLTIGTLVAQLLMLASSPWIARLYSPEEFATYGLFASFVLVGSIIITAGYDAAIPLPKEDGDARALLRSVLQLCLIWTLVGTLCIASIHERFHPVWVGLPLAIGLHGAMQVWTQWTLRTEQINTQAWSKVAMSAVLVSTQLVGGRVGLGSIGLIIGYILGRVVSIGIQRDSLLQDGAKDSFERGKHTLSWHKMSLGLQNQRRVLKEYIQQPMFVMPSSLLSMAAKEVPVFLVAAWFSQELLGQYSFAYRILAAPATLLAMSLGAIFTQRAAKRVQEQQILGVWVQKLWGSLAGAATLPFLMIGLFGKPLFIWVFGEPWAVAGELSQWLSLMLFLQFITLPTSRILMVIGAAKWQPISSGVDLFVRVLALWFGYTQGGVFAEPGFLGAIQTMVIAQALVQIGNLILIWSITKAYDRNVKHNGKQ
jgi:O-antigen/teichoic acid export membrane protein